MNRNRDITRLKRTIKAFKHDIFKGALVSLTMEVIHCILSLCKKQIKVLKSMENSQGWQ